MISYSRIYLGVHYPGDVICGALLGIGVGIGIFKLLNYAESRLSPVNLFARNPLKDREANRIIEVGVFTIIMCIGIIAMLLVNDVIPH
jgi:undecaprenyl-diphosphatase